MRFNGAGMFLSRKLAPRRPAMPRLMASMGPGCFYPGNERPRSACPAPLGFNGAGMFLSRKSQSVESTAYASSASMGPGCFYPGNARTKSQRESTESASMGPGCFYPGNAALRVGSKDQPPRFNGAGMFLSRKSGYTERWNGSSIASMGPGCFYPGNNSCTLLLLTLWALQWGRDVSIPEIFPVGPRACRVGSFNGAGMFLSRKSALVTSAGGTVVRFNGAGMFLSRK